MTIPALNSPFTYGSWTYTSPFEQYVYAYPHKTAYRPLDPEPALADVWAGEDTSTLFLYVHLPFCKIRCGFCNLFTRTGAPEELTTAYLDALERQATAVRDALGDAAFAQAAFGGGTPTYLTASELERLCLLTQRLTGGTSGVGVPLGVETSPDTATPDRLAILRDFGTSRISIGVQSFVEAEVKAVARPLKTDQATKALDAIRDAGFPVLNIDLIYGITGQTEESWLASIDRALEWRPEELYLYPLYKREKTGLEKLEGIALDPVWDEQRLRLYRAGRDHLLALGYEQVSMRMFRRPGEGGGTEYCCQEDGMVGLGCGARSYTSRLHYSFEYAVEASAVRSIIDEYVLAEDFSRARVGFALDESERRRRHLLQSLLQADGVDVAAYTRRFRTDPEDDADLTPFAAKGWLERTPETIRLTPEGLAYSDALGPALFTPEVQHLMDTYTPR
ncbi:STM4012 family radical SAM protein [Actinocorallia sp. A-T 12471]|uniref:STM4012 family radical SAM protein n=1 Tax=Actinocorallia sp. A-T 12471 TaxID=3089813 RepID=UPI0029CAF515|nr:STM4012 family radical SAM protein [Actinocorallia sp. A-T 12471]MDX6739862.1 STM4012 family radical SAM protein [Actinocorallia sp. A-T 12471]